jgi:hypothetical protein
MVARAIASVLVLAFGVLFSAPAVASVTCRPAVVTCSHCPKTSRALASIPALRPDCCIITEAPVRPALETHRALPMTFMLFEALDQHLLAPLCMRGRMVAAWTASSGASPPLLQMPLLC